MLRVDRDLVRIKIVQDGRELVIPAVILARLTDPPNTIRAEFFLGDSLQIAVPPEAAIIRRGRKKGKVKT